MKTNVFHMGGLIRMAFWISLSGFVRHIVRPAVRRKQDAHSNNPKETKNQRRKDPLQRTSV